MFKVSKKRGGHSKKKMIVPFTIVLCCKFLFAFQKQRGHMVLNFPCIYTSVYTYTHVDALTAYCTMDDRGVKLIISGSTSGFY